MWASARPRRQRQRRAITGAAAEAVGNIGLDAKLNWHRSPRHPSAARPDLGIGQAGRVFQALVAQPEDVEAGIVAADDLLVREGAPAAVGVLFRPRGPALAAVVRVVALDEALERRAATSESTPSSTDQGFGSPLEARCGSSRLLNLVSTPVLT
jgi:hypothetical protein